MALHTFGGTRSDVLTTGDGQALPDWPLRVRVAATGETITALYEMDGVTPVGELRTDPVSSPVPGRIRAFRCEAAAITYEYPSEGGELTRRYAEGREVAAEVPAARTDGATDRAPDVLDLAEARVFVVRNAVGDGVADDRAVIQAQLDLARDAGGGTVVIPGGRVYGCGTFLVVYDNTTVMAHGATVRAIGRGAGLLRNFLADETFSGYRGRSHIKVIGGTWDGNAYDGSQGTVTATTDIMNWIHGSDITVKDATFTNTSSAHALEFNSVDGGQAVNCRFLGFRDNSGNGSRATSEAIQIDLAKPGSSSIGEYDNTPARNILVSGCYFGPSERLGPFGRAVGSHAAVDGVYFDNIQILGNRVDGTFAEGVHGYCWRRVVVADNVISGTGRAGIKLTHPNPATAGFGLTPHGLSVHDNVIDSPAVDAGISVLAYSGAQASGVKIADNVIRAAGGVGIRCDYCAAPSITGNVSETSGGSGILTRFGSGAVISGNTVKAAGSNGISVSNHSGATVTGNAVDTTATNHGIFLGDAGDALVSGNHVAAAASAGIRLSTNAVRCTVTTNKVRRATGTTANGVTLADTATGCVVAGNDLSGNNWQPGTAIVAATGSAPVLDWAGGTTSPGHNRV
ncbi:MULTISPECIES: right-handed parallel beta-helix repeat-containing protein [unclassified Streptomyces]|uniref:right-handed parallel beta-helix repeat-containing protein n=1 Tax=unclassified Streptomyces TaxID=2593676 RepID=UPI00382CC8DB